MAQRMLDDEEIQRRVLDELAADPDVEPTDVGVEVDSGVITLTGTVANYPMKFAAERAAHRVPGVKAVANDINVRSPSERAPTDTDIASAAATALESDPRIPRERIEVTVRNGWVTLEGNVDSLGQKKAAEQAVRGLTGVKGVSDLIVVAMPVMSGDEIKARIVEAFERRAKLDAIGLVVAVVHGKVVLSGSVRAMFEREEAEKVAWATEGVDEVDNQIIVLP